MKILLADDDHMVRFMISEMLDDLDCEYDTCVDGAEAVGRVCDAPRTYSLVLMDIHMLTVSGIEAVAKIRKSKNHVVRHIPIIAITADRTWQNPHKAKTAGFDDVMEKPVSFQALKRQIDAISQQETAGN